jgi:hypothetical protein
VGENNTTHPTIARHMMKSLLTKKTYKNTTTMTESDPAANEEAVPTAAVVAVVVSPVTPGGELAYDWPTNVPPPAAEVLHLWTEVGNGLEKSQTGTFHFFVVCLVFSYGWTVIRPKLKNLAVFFAESESEFLKKC